MIEFLDEHDDYFNTAYTTSDQPEVVKRNRTVVWEYDQELCDTLWLAVKEILERVS